MSNQLQITGGAKVRNLNGVITGTTGVLDSLPINAANGIPQLDSSGKILVSQLPNSVMEYKGTWNVTTNTPYLVNGVGNAGDVYIVTGAATGGTNHDFGAGNILFYNGDQAIYDGSAWQRASGSTGSVTSVGITESGDALTITGSPITTSGTINIGFAGTGSQYIKGDGTLATFPTTIDQAKRLITEVYNSTGATLTKGTVVYINGGQGNLPTVTKALATSDATSAQTYGVVQSDITNNNNGYVVVIGSLTDLDTQAYTVGTQLYLSGTTAGAWTSTKPYAPIHLVYVGIVVRSHPTQGVVEIRIQNGYELEELHNVYAQTPSNGDILQYNSSTSLWTSVAGTTSNISEGTNLYFTNARARAAISLTTSGTSGASTYNSTTGVLNIPQYQGVITNPVTGVGSADSVAFWNSASNITYDSSFYYNSTLKRLGVNTTTPNATIGANCDIDGNYGLLVKNSNSNYNGIGFGITSNYGNLIEAQKNGSAPQRNLTLLNNAGFISIDGSGNLGINQVNPICGPAGIGGTGIDVYSGSGTAASIGFHTIYTGSTNAVGAYLSLNSSSNFIIRNLSGQLILRADADLSLNTNGTTRLLVDGTTGRIGIGNPASISEMLTVNGSIRQTGSISGMVKTNSSGVFLNAVAGTDYVEPSALSAYVPNSRTISINGLAYDLSADRAWIVGNVTGGGSNGRVAFWDSGSNITNNALFVWDDIAYRLGIGLNNPQRKLEIYSSVADTHLRLSGSAPSISMGEAIIGSVYQAKFGLATASNQYVTGSVAGDFVINNQTGSTIWAYDSTEKMRLDTNGNFGIGGIAGSSYRLNVFAPSPMIGIESTGSGNMYLRLLQTGSVRGSLYWINADSTLYLSNNAAGIKFQTSGADPALTLAPNGAATFASGIITNSSITINDTNGGLLLFRYSGTTDWTLGEQSGELSRNFNLYNSLTGTINLSVNRSTGNVGIGTTSPLKILHIAQGGNNNGILWTDDAAGNYRNEINNTYAGGTAASNLMTFKVSNGTTTGQTTVMNLTGSGNVGIGTTSPSYPLTVISNSSTQGFRLAGRSSDNIANMSFTSNDQATEYAFMNSGATYLAIGTNGSERMRITSGGELYWNVSGISGGDITNGGVLFRNNSNKYVQIITGSTADAPLIYFYKNNGSGGVTLTGSISTTGNNTAYNTTSSDRDLKKNFEDWEENILDVFKNSNPQLFNFKTEDDSEKKTKGFIAQELYDYFPEAYPINQEEKHLFNPSGMVIYLMKAMKEAAEKIQQLETKVLALENK